MPDEWFSVDNLRRAWRYARLDMRDDFAFDVIDHQDVSMNLERVLAVLSAQLRHEQYFPAPIISVAVPKNDHSVRPGTVIPPVDLIVLYGIAQQLAPRLDTVLSECVYSYRLNPQRERRGQPLFDAVRAADQTDGDEEAVQARNPEEDAETQEVAFPYNWFFNWLPFHQDTRSAASEFAHVAVTDITAYFENISLRILFKRLHELLGPDYRHLLDRLRGLLEYWDWAVSGEKAPGTGLPQGNDVSSFLSNVYLRDLDQAMLAIVGEDRSKYYRYVDDIRLYSDSDSEARAALVSVERTLRTLGLNVQAAKTEVKPARETSDPDVDEWMQRLEHESAEKAHAAGEFIRDTFDVTRVDSVAKWQRVFLRCLTVLGQENDECAVEPSLHLFLEDPTAKMLWKNFRYLRRFAAHRHFEEAVYRQLVDEAVVFDYHRAYLYRLAAYSRGDHAALKDLALEDGLDPSIDWFRRVGALLYLSTCRLTSQDLASLSRAADSEGNTQVARAQYVSLCQHGGDELRWVLDRVSYLNQPHQDYLRRYLFRLARDDDVGERVLTAISRDEVANPLFIRNLHKMDLVKANRSLRARFHEVLEQKLEGCMAEWPRLHSRLDGIRQAFIDNP